MNICILELSILFPKNLLFLYYIQVVRFGFFWEKSILLHMFHYFVLPWKRPQSFFICSIVLFYPENVLDPSSYVPLFCFTLKTSSILLHMFHCFVLPWKRPRSFFICSIVLFYPENALDFMTLYHTWYKIPFFRKLRKLSSQTNFIFLSSFRLKTKRSSRFYQKQNGLKYFARINLCMKGKLKLGKI